MCWETVLWLMMLTTALSSWWRFGWAAKLDDDKGWLWLLLLLQPCEGSWS